MQNTSWVIRSIFCSILDFPQRAQPVHSSLYPAKCGEISVQTDRKKVGNTKIRTRRAVFQLKLGRKVCLKWKYVSHKSHSKILWPCCRNILSLRVLPPRMLITKQKSHCSPLPKTHAANTLCGKQGLQRGFVHLSQPALPYFSVPLAKWTINNSLLTVQVVIGWMCHQLAHPRSEAGKV